jgi:hypothetical protein
VTLPEALQSLVTVTKVRDTLELPDRTPGDGAQGGLRLGRLLTGFDMALSYVYTRDDFPLPHQVTVSVPDTVSARQLGQALLAETPLPLDADATLQFPRQHIVGFDISGALGDIGAWGEVAVFFPERVITTARLEDPVAEIPPLLLTGFPEGASALVRGEEVVIDTALDDSPYIKLAVGGDYTFENGLYVNAQYVHGFVQERGDELGDFIVAEVSWDLLDDRMTIMPFGIGLEVADLEDIEGSYALLYQPEVTWKPFDNLDLTAGLRVIEGKEGSTFGALDDLDHLYIRSTYVF